MVAIDRTPLTKARAEVLANRIRAVGTHRIDRIEGSNGRYVIHAIAVEGGSALRVASHDDWMEVRRAVLRQAASPEAQEAGRRLEVDRRSQARADASRSNEIDKPLKETLEGVRRVQEWVKAQAEGRSSVDMPAIAADLKEWLLMHPRFLHDYIERDLYGICYREVVTVLGTWRRRENFAAEYQPPRHIHTVPDARKADETLTEKERAADRITAAKVDERLRTWQATHSRWSIWMETIEPHNTKSLSHLTRRDLLVAADNRDGVATVNMQTASLWRALAEPMTEVERVCDRYTPDDVALHAETCGFNALSVKENVPA